MAGPAIFWAARLGLRVAPGHVQGFVGWFANVDDLSDLYVALPLEGDRDVFLAAGELPAVMLPDPHRRVALPLDQYATAAEPAISPGALVEKRRGQFAYRFDGVRGRWPLRSSHVALFVGGLLAFCALAVSFARAREEGAPRALVWLGVPGRLALLLGPAACTVLVGVSVAFSRGALDGVTGVAMLATALGAVLAWTRGSWRRLREAVVLRRARRLAASSAAVADLRGTVRSVTRDVVELATDDGRVVQADLSGCERLGLGPLPHAPLGAGDRIEVIGAPGEVLDQHGEHFGREAALMQRLRAAGPRPVLIAPVP